MTIININITFISNLISLLISVLPKQMFWYLSVI